MPNKKIKKVKKSNCEHQDFWSIYKIINFHRMSLKGKCALCGKNIVLQSLQYEMIAKNLSLRLFNGMLWMSPALLIIVFSVLLADVYGPWIYGLAVIAVIIFHFYGMYYIVRGGLMEVVSKK